jgi:uncharacterized protein DUF262
LSTSDAQIGELEETSLGWGDGNDEEEPVPKDTVTSAVVTDTDWTAETILSQLRRGNIQLNPRFQRRDAWDQTRKSRFIESLILGLPIPQLVLAEDRRRRGTFIVLDGKQRLLALRQFAEGSSFGIGDADTEFRRLRLSGLDVRPDLHGYNLKALEDDPSKLDDLNAVLNQTIRTVVVRRWPSEEFLNLVFLRLNTGSVALSPQELRQALHPGDFTDFIDDFAAESALMRRALRIKGPDFRMRDVELLLRYYAFRVYLPDYRGNLKKFLDSAVEQLNDRWSTQAQDIQFLASEFESSIEAAFETFGENAFFRWDINSSRYERRFNRAIFDAVMYHFASVDVRAAAVEQASAVTTAFVDLCSTNSEFVRSIQATTKSVGATFHRINTWGGVLSNVLDVDVPIVLPKWDGSVDSGHGSDDTLGQQ